MHIQRQSFQNRGENRPGYMNNENDGIPPGHTLIQLWSEWFHYESITSWIQKCWHSFFVTELQVYVLIKCYSIVKIVMSLGWTFIPESGGSPCPPLGRIADSECYCLLLLSCDAGTCSADKRRPKRPRGRHATWPLSGWKKTAAEEIFYKSPSFSYFQWGA